MNRAKLIIVEGADRVGKETHSKLLVENIKKLGFRVQRFEIPNRDHLTYRAIYWMLENKLASKFPTLFQCIQHANKRIFQSSYLELAMASNDYVVLDRWKLSSLVYGKATGANLSIVEKLASTLIEPDMTIVLTRTGKKVVPEDEYEADELLQLEVKVEYLVRACSEKNMMFVRNDGSVDSCQEQIINNLTTSGILPDVFEETLP